MFIFNKVLDSERLRKENKQLIGKYVVIGRSEGEWLLVILLGGRKEYRVLDIELSKEQYKDAYGTLLYKS